MSVLPAASLAALAAPAVPTAALAIELRHDLEWMGAEAAAVEGLLAGRPSLAVFLSRAWLTGLFAEPPGGQQPAIVLLREGRTLRGLVPVGIERRRAHVRVALLGGGAGSDRTDLLAARGYEAACADAFLGWLHEAFGARFVLELRDVPAESALWGGVHRANAERRSRLAVQPREVHTLPFLDLDELAAPAAPGAAWPWHPRSLPRHRRWLERRGALRVELLDDERAVLEAFDTLTRLLHERWRGHQGGSALDAPRARAFHRGVLPRLLRDGHLRMLRLASDARTVAVFYGLAAAGWWGYLLAGYDREWAGRIHLGQVTLAAAIDRARQEGAAEFDFLKGAHAVKYLWPVRERATLDGDVYAPASGPQARRARWAAGQALAACVKAGRARGRG